MRINYAQLGLTTGDFIEILFNTYVADRRIAWRVDWDRTVADLTLEDAAMKTQFDIFCELLAGVQRNIKEATVTASIQTEDGLRAAIINTTLRPSTVEWWRYVAGLYHAYKRINPKFTYGQMAEILSMDEKYVGRQIKKYHTKKH